MSQKAMLISIKLSRITAATQLMQTHSAELHGTALGSSPILIIPIGVIMRLGIISQAFSRAAPDLGRKFLADQQNLNRVGSIAGLTGSKSIMLAGKFLPCGSSAACKFLDCQKQQCLTLVLSRLLFWNVPRNGIQIAILMRESLLLKISSKRHRPHTSTCSLVYNRVAGFIPLVMHFLSDTYPMTSARNCTLQQSSVNCRDQCVRRKCHICHAFVTMTRHAGQEAFVQPIHEPQLLVRI